MEAVVYVGCAGPKHNRSVDGGIFKRGKESCSRVVEETRVPQIISQLTTNLDPCQSRMTNASGYKAEGQVCLIKSIATLSRIVISGYSNFCFVWRHCTRDIILIVLVVVTKKSTISDVESSDLVIERSRSKVHSHSHRTVVRIPKVS